LIRHREPPLGGAAIQSGARSAVALDCRADGQCGIDPSRNNWPKMPIQSYGMRRAAHKPPMPTMAATTAGITSQVTIWSHVMAEAFPEPTAQKYVGQRRAKSRKLQPQA